MGREGASRIREYGAGREACAGRGAGRAGALTGTGVAVTAVKAVATTAATARR